MYNKEYFFNLLSSFNVTDKDLSVIANVSLDIVSEWKSGKSRPNIDEIYKIANFLDCSVDFLIGRTDSYNSHKVSISATLPPSLSVFADLSEIFNPDDMFLRYISHIWESWNSLLVANHSLNIMLSLFSEKQQTSVWVPSFKHCVLVLFEAAEIIDYTGNTFKHAQSFLFKQDSINPQYTQFTNFFNDKTKEFLRYSRHMFGHFDHERSSHFSEFIKKQTHYEGCIFNNGFGDTNNPVNLNVLIQIYDFYFTDDKQLAPSADDSASVIAKIIGKFQELSERLIALDKAILDFFFSEYTNFEEILSCNSDTLKLTKQVGIPFSASQTKEAAYNPPPSTVEDKHDDVFSSK